MITYLIKTLLCATIMFLIYFLFLEREKMYRFNRFYLLFSIVFSFGVSFITIKTASPVVTVNELIAPVHLPGIVAKAGGFNRLSHKETTSDLKQSILNVPVEKKSPLPNILLGLYLAGTAFFLFRFILNLSNLLSKVNRNKSINYHGAKLVLAKDIALPYSFMRYIFLDKDKFEQGSIEKEILEHELTHVHQKHSIDVLFIELIMVFAWINPLLFLYRKAIMLNHEYLADEAVIKTYNDSFKYQLLLFHSVSQSNKLVLASPFNYLITKKRFLMMTKKTSQKTAIIKQIALIPLIAAIGFLFSASVVAQDNTRQPANQEQILSSKIDAPQSILDEYHAIITRYNIKLSPLEEKMNEGLKTRANKSNSPTSWYSNIDVTFKITDTDRTRLEELFFQLSKRQQCREQVGFKTKPQLREKIVPSKDKIELWKNPKIYGLYIETKRVNNAVLNQHINTDYYYFHEYKLENESLKKYNYQVEVQLFTKRQFETDRKATLAMRNKTPYKYDLVFQNYSEKTLAEIDAGVGRGY